MNWLGNTAPRGIKESFGIMVNYLYDPDAIEANHEVFAREGRVVRSEAVDGLMADPASAEPKSPSRSPGCRRLLKA